MRDIDYNVLMEDGDGIFTEQVRASNHREAVREAKRRRLISGWLRPSTCSC
jgi:hypothetical protein